MTSLPTDWSTELSTGLVGGTWTADPAATSARFRARDVLGRTVLGTLAVHSAAVEVAPSGDPLRVRAELDLGSVATGSGRRDADLRGPRFLDAARDAVLRVTADAARPDGPGRWHLVAELAMKGLACPVELDVELTDLRDGRAAVRATTALDRRALGIAVPRLLVGRTVAVEVLAVLHAPTP